MIRRGPSDLTSVGRIIAKSMEEGFLGLAKEMFRVFEVWEKAVGSFNAARARPESIKNGCLTVIVAGSAWIDHFTYFKAEFINNINQALGAPLVKEIVFRVGELTPTTSNQSSPVSPGATPGDRDDFDETAVQAALDSIQDPQLKEGLAAFLSRQKSLRPE